MQIAFSKTSIEAMRDRFMEKVAPEPVNGCWIWAASKMADGYGLFFNGAKTERAHRVAYRLWNGPIQQGLSVLHQCDNPSCVNPSHLFLGTQKDNVDDMMKKGRSAHAAGSSHGRAKLSEANVLDIREDQRRHVDIAAAYGVSRGLISMIKARKIWAHI
jgi:hypothetical protein